MSSVGGCRMTFIEAAFQILGSSRKPLTTREITERALEKGLINTRGKTPGATMSAALYKALQTGDRLVKLADPAPGRARRGSVRWTTQSATQHAVTQQVPLRAP